MPPVLMKLRVRQSGRHGFGLWLPLFLAWLLLLPLLLAALPLVLLADLIMLALGYRFLLLRSLWALLSLVSAMRGLKVSVDARGSRDCVDINII